MTRVEGEAQRELEATLAARAGARAGPRRSARRRASSTASSGRSTSRIDERIAAREPRKRAPSPLNPGNLGVCIPIVVLAGVFGHTAGVVVALIALATVFLIAELRR